MEVVDEICDLLQSHANRDKVVSLASYTLKLWGATARSPALLQASGRLAAARAALRLFDDAAAIRAVYNYGLGKHEGAAWGALGAVGGALTLGYLQAEKLVFLLDVGALALPAPHADTARAAHKLLWTLSAFVGFVRSVRALHAASQHARREGAAKCAGARATQAALLSGKLLLDTLHAGSWLPRGCLWGGRVPPARAAALAAAAALMGLAAHYHGKRLMPR